MIYIYKINGYFLTIKNGKLGKTKNAKKISIWDNKKDALSWKYVVMQKYPTAEFKEITLTTLT